jgi:streptomycin 6-kinase
MSARTQGGQEVVVKAPPTIAEAAAEAAALNLWRTTGAAVPVLHFDDQQGVLVLERLRPGVPLAGDSRRSTAIAADLLARLHACDASQQEFPLIEDLYPEAELQARRDNEYERRSRGDPRRGEAGLELLPAAARTIEALTHTTSGRTVLHGDFSNKNILSAGAAFVVIDPIPKLGDSCTDVANYAITQPADEIFDTANTLCRALGLDPRRTERWTAAYAVLQDCQAWRKDQAALDALLQDTWFQNLLD